MSLDIQRIVLEGEQRGVTELVRQMPSEQGLTDSGRFFINKGLSNRTVLIATGFFILGGKAVETDGPPGAVAIGEALRELGIEVAYLTDARGMEVVSAVANGAVVEEFPIAGIEESDEAARALLERYNPSLLIAIERCAPSADGLYRNMRGVDLTPFTGRIDRLFEMHRETIGIGDGGNEIGMGRFAKRIAKISSLPDMPAATKTSKLVVAGTSNWGAWALLASVARQLRDSFNVSRDLLPTPEQEWERVERCVEAGAVDGFSGERVAKVDGMGREEYLRPLIKLREMLAS